MEILLSILSAALEQLRNEEEPTTQRLKPGELCSFYGTAEAVPFQSEAPFRQMLSHALIQAPA